MDTVYVGERVPYDFGGKCGDYLRTMYELVKALKAVKLPTYILEKSVWPCAAGTQGGLKDGLPAKNRANDCTQYNGERRDFQPGRNSGKLAGEWCGTVASKCPEYLVVD